MPIRFIGDVLDRLYYNLVHIAHLKTYEDGPLGWIDIFVGYLGFAWACHINTKCARGRLRSVNNELGWSVGFDNNHSINIHVPFLSRGKLALWFNIWLEW